MEIEKDRRNIKYILTHRLIYIYIMEVVSNESYSCTICNLKDIESRNKLFKHVKTCKILSEQKIQMYVDVVVDVSDKYIYVTGGR